MIPVEKIIINPIRKIVEILAKYALGVYCSHRLVAKYLFEILQEEGIETGTFLQSVWIYILSLMFCCLIAKVFGEYAKISSIEKRLISSAAFFSDFINKCLSKDGFNPNLMKNTSSSRIHFGVIESSPSSFCIRSCSLCACHCFGQRHRRSS